MKHNARILTSVDRRTGLPASYGTNGMNGKIYRSLHRKRSPAISSQSTMRRSTIIEEHNATIAQKSMNDNGDRTMLLQTITVQNDSRALGTGHSS